MITPKEKKDLMRHIGRGASIKVRLALLVLGPLAALFPGVASVAIAKAVAKAWKGLSTEERINLAWGLEELIDD